MDDDPKATARKAISHLAYDGLTGRWEIPGELSEAARALVEYDLADGEIGETLEYFATKYVMKRLADDHLGLRGFEMTDSGETRPPASR